MKLREYDPLRLDVERFADDRGTLHGRWPLQGMDRLVEALHPEERPSASDGVDWSAKGERRRQGTGTADAWLQLGLDTHVKLTCQCCLGAVTIALKLDPSFRFVAGGEDAAARLDVEADEDVLASTRSLDLRQLAEDELLLALPLIPRHDVCPQPLLPAAPDAALDEFETVNPFAALAALKRDIH